MLVLAVASAATTTDIALLAATVVDVVVAICVAVVASFAGAAYLVEPAVAFPLLPSSSALTISLVVAFLELQAPFCPHLHASVVSLVLLSSKE